MSDDIYLLYTPVFRVEGPEAVQHTDYILDHDAHRFLMYLKDECGVKLKTHDDLYDRQPFKDGYDSSWYVKIDANLYAVVVDHDRPVLTVYLVLDPMEVE